jgi:prepilin-type N-terminal cleavage/methylation domain-containing protein/prepilin-type processing-associated H-X9-DG protein
MFMPQVIRCRRGFTLVELLVTLGIIALLVSILMPALRNARMSAKTVKCASNLGQLGQGCQLWGQDHPKETFKVGDWRANVAPYLTSPTLVCPQSQENDDTFNVVLAKVSDYSWPPGGPPSEVLLAPGPNCISMLPGAGPPKRKAADNNPDAAKLDHYELWIDDRPGYAKADGDFNDIGFDIKIQPDGSVVIQNLQKSAGDKFDLIDVVTGEILIHDVNNGTRAIIKRVSGGPSSYGMNENVYNKIRAKGRVLAMDYYTGGIKYTDVWPLLPGGRPRFARHQNATVNILLGDGSVRLVPWVDIDFHNSAKLNLHWIP